MIAPLVELLRDVMRDITGALDGLLHAAESLDRLAEISNRPTVAETLAAEEAP